MTLLLESANLVAAFVNMAVVAMLILACRRLRLGYPRLLLSVTAFFLLAAVDRLAAPDPFLGYSPLVDASTDVLTIAVLVLLLFDAGRLARGLLMTMDIAAYRAMEYERATYHYAQLMRHRIANPLTVVKGAAQTLQGGAVDDGTRAQLLAAIVEAADQLEQVSATPAPVSEEEWSLDATPRLRGPSDGGTTGSGT